MDFGVTVLPDPPYQRFVELIQRAEELGFHYGWTYDSHVLWQESFPTLALAAQATTESGSGTWSPTPARASRPWSRARTRRCRTSRTGAW